ncbi:hypothetical protein [Umezawaea sp.]|uniref:hypothetical protein n=1 Tax=Umezawaea sp. TaxID=1955258 RepID=UPI002ED4EA23
MVEVVRLRPTGAAADRGPVDLRAEAVTAGHVSTPSYREFRRNPPAWYEEIHTRLRKDHSSRRTRVEHGIAHLKNWRSLTRHLSRRETLADTVRAVAGLLSEHQHHDRIEVARPAARYRP